MLNTKWLLVSALFLSAPHGVVPDPSFEYFNSGATGTNATNITLAFLGPSMLTYPYIYFGTVEQNGPAISMAVEDARKRGLLNSLNVRVVWRDDYCKGKQGMAAAVELQWEEQVDMIAGPFCSPVCVPVGHYWSHWNIPVFSHGATDGVLSDKKTYNTLVRVGPIYNKYGGAFVEIFKKFGWTRTVMLVKQTRTCDYGATSIEEEFYQNNLTVAEWIRMNDERTITDKQIDWYLDKFRQRARAIILCLSRPLIKRILLRAWRSGMTTNGEYVFFTYTMMPYDTTFEPWEEVPPEEMAEVKLAYRSFKQMTMASLSGPDVDSFRQAVLDRLAYPPWDALTPAGLGSLYSLMLYDAVYLYLMLVNETITEGGNYKDGNLLATKARGRSFEGKSGHVLMDDKADRTPDFWLWHLAPNEDKFTFWAEVRMTSPSGERVDDNTTNYWYTKDNSIPRDTPLCGYTGELCEAEADQTLVIGLAATCVAAGAVLGAFLLYLRKKRRDELLYQMIWKLNFTDIQLGAAAAKSSHFGSSRMSRSFMSSRVSLIKESHELLANLGFYKGNPVCIKRFKIDNVTLNKDDLRHLKEMKDLTHENLNTFVGACMDAPNICTVMAYCPKGSLQDILENDDVELDLTFKYSLTSDLANGLHYLHAHALRCHGNLKSSNCLVDSRWVLKLSSFGLYPFKREAKKEEVGEYQKFKAYLWTAPELLRMYPDVPVRGSPKGDVYSFALVVQEILYRSLPYFLDSQKLSPKEIFNRVKAGNSPPFRPQLPSGEGGSVNPIMTNMMKACWREDPAERPDLDAIKRMIRELNKGRKVNIVDNMLQRLEKYANNLEDIVQQRTEQLMVEKKKTDTLLYRMLPASIAEELKTGKSVKPEVYGEVTIYFSDIVQFTDLCAGSTPVQVITLLNDLYTLFDTIIEEYDVYKVETIGDAYMVVSGLPKRNGNRHVAEIADMSLALLHAVSTSFRVRHQPDYHLKLRIGLHSGSCAAGVVGVAMPRYCLFGDTVNMAARMESNGEALKIHMSSEAHKILVQHQGYRTVERGQIMIKGKGMQTTYWLNGKIGSPHKHRQHLGSVEKDLL